MTEATTTNEQHPLDAAAQANAEHAAKIAAIKASISARYLPMIALFAAKQDIRYYLNGVYVCPAPEHLGGIYLVGTNGHVMAVIHDKEGTIEGAESLIFRVTDGLVRACNARTTWTKKVLITGDRVTVAHDFEGIGTDSETYVMPGRSLIHGKFPKWQAVVPDFAKLKPGMASAVQAKYLTLFDKVSSKTGMFNGVRFWHEEPGQKVTVQVDTIPELLGIIMPMYDKPEDGRQHFGLFPAHEATKPKGRRS